jgi:hypothetical protein
VAYFGDPKEDAAWTLILYHRPQNLEDHDADCPGLTDHLEARRDSCPTCRQWLADLIREDRRADAEERRPRA